LACSPINQGGSKENRFFKSVYSFFKGSLKIYPIPENTDIAHQNLFFSNVKQVLKEECVVRIYIVRGIDLQAKDSNGKVKI